MSENNSLPDLPHHEVNTFFCSFRREDLKKWTDAVQKKLTDTQKELDVARYQIAQMAQGNFEDSPEAFDIRCQIYEAAIFWLLRQPRYGWKEPVIQQFITEVRNGQHHSWTRRDGRTR